LESRVGKTCGTVQDGSAEEDHVEPLEDGASGETVEDGLLVEAAGVEVGIAQSSAERGTLQALIADDKLGFHGGVLVVLGDPVGYAFGKWVVVERIA